MNRLDTAAKILVVATLLTAMSVFTEATPLTLVALVLGGVMVALGSLYAYRPGALIGVVVVAVGAAASIELDSILDVSSVLTAVLGLLIPLFLLTLHALGTEQGDVRVMAMRARPAVLALLFGIVCLMSAPLISGLIGLALPTMTVRFSGTAETAIILIVAAAGTILLTMRTSTRKTIGPASPAAEE